MTLARAALAVLIGMAALVGSSGVAGADPENAAPPIIDDLLVLIPALTQDPRTLNPGDKGDARRDWGSIGMICQNRNVKCQKNGF
ncbi:MAG: hypothetical protein K2X97_18020 [Mycobacteriaceae bacterium]|nr:hypothetical protein [Mycobacteriaceae bacterium]